MNIAGASWVNTVVIIFSFVILSMSGLHKKEVETNFERNIREGSLFVAGALMVVLLQTIISYGKALT